MIKRSSCILPIAPKRNWNKAMSNLLSETIHFQSHQRGIEIYAGVVVIPKPSFFQSHQRGIEILLDNVSLVIQNSLPIAPKRNWNRAQVRSQKGKRKLPIAPKRNWNAFLKKNLFISFCFQSHQRGIEIQILVSLYLHLQASNRTKEELKCKS